MLEIIPSPDHVVALRAGGKIKRADVERAVAAIEERIARHGHVALYAEIGPVEGMTVEAMSADLRYGMRQLGHLDRFGPTAVVTDEAWIGNLSRLEGWMLPSMELRVFPHDRAAEAMAYAAGGERPRAPSGDRERAPGVRRVPTDRHDALAFEIDGRVSPDAMQGVMRELTEAFDTHSNGIDLLVRIRSLRGLDMTALGSGGLWRTKLRSLTGVRRYAVVGGPDWIASTATFAGRFTEVDVRHFRADEEDRAWAWIDARPLEDASAGAARTTERSGRSDARDGRGERSPWADRGAA